MFEIYDIYCIVGEVIHADLLKEYKYIRKDQTGKYAPCEYRESVKMINKLNYLFEKFETDDF